MNLELDAHPQIREDVAGFERLNGRFTVRIEARFESAHFLYRYFPDGRDEPVHGHTWLVEVFLRGPGDGTGADGISYDFLAARKRLDQLVERIEHVCINDLAEFQEVNPTAENIARWFCCGLAADVKSSGGRIVEVRVHEGPTNYAIFEPTGVSV
ncbi:MAG: 6-carboxytetrahydropterin synthase [Spirochaetales bacterium]|nr:6-carboxytetrahydropterin synthase [Leptospiraceae bacterium]MCP5480574.1 6-carboxytetrahydropterin synthase [Spirochaetales bacterium]MCP5483924.1 6-carboxytetrahydropterin synthase [Spirochaetales bacterium]